MDICLEALNLSKSFDSLPVLDNWNLVIAKGERLAILGPSGCGKTTFLRLIAGLEIPTHGVLRLNYVRMGYVFQEPRLIPWRVVKDNLLFIRPNGSYHDYLDWLGLTGFENYYPEQLSGGMKQRVNLARALINEPDILILDEAFFALDIGNKIKIMRSINDLWKKYNFTLISVTHDPRDALLLAERIVILSNRPSHIQEEFKVMRSDQMSITSSEFQKNEANLIDRLTTPQP